MKFSEYPYKRPDLAAVAEQYRELAKRVRAAASAQEVIAVFEQHERLLIDFDTLSSLAQIRNTIDTRDKFYEAEVEYLTENLPVVSEAMSVFLLSLLESPFRPQLEEKYPKIIFTNAELEVKTVSPAVVEQLGEEGALALQYQRLIASAQLEYKGEKKTIAQLGVYKTDPDRAVRREVFCIEGEFYRERRAELDGIYDKMVAIRTEIAKKLGFPSFVELAYCRRTRNCYDAKMVKVFRDEVKKHLVPLIAKLKKIQAERIGVDRIKLHDDSIRFKEGNPRPVGSFEDTYKSGVELYREMRPETREFIDFMDKSELFSLVATPGKAAGGYCSFLAEYKAPFIFSNFNGTAGDVDVFTHEGGHAFQAYVAARTMDTYEAASPTMESCEVHSMSMEFLAWPWLESFYKERTDDAKYAHLLSALTFIPYGCMVDEFQHIVYENPSLTPQERAEAWSRLETEYRPYLDLDGIPTFSEGRLWQRQLHIYELPFYYIDYCLAQTVALQIFAIMQDKGWDEAWSRYYAFLERAGTLSFTGLLDAAKLQSPFEAGSLEFICKVVNDYIDSH